jgi:arginine decarboxylase
MQDIRTIKNTIGELAQVYVRLKELGAKLGYLDVGGGVGVDYTGEQENRPSSMNYTLDEYASDVIYRIGSVCDAAGVPHPTVLTECGRAMVAHASVLVVDVLGSTGPRRLEVVGDPRRWVSEGETVPQPILDLYDAHEAVSPERVSECYHDATQALESAMTLFNLGYLSLPLRGLAERLFWSVCTSVADVCQRMPEDEIPAELWNLHRVLSDVYFCNFSLFQSLPDAWAIDQVFPIAPIHRLDERPTRNAVLADITCDSDGTVDRFIGEGEGEDGRVLEVHDLRDGEDYLLGFFLVGAYQETLGDLHNLFGDTHVVHLSVDDQSGWVIEEFVPGDTTREVLGYMQYTPDRLASRFERDCEEAVRRGRVTVGEARVLRRFFSSSLSSYTYLDGPDPESGSRRWNGA